jgi:DNA-binding response OmpR family regulator
MNPPKGRILYTEDDPDSRELIRYVFTRGGYEVICAESSRETLRLAKQEHFDLFLLDNWLPDLTGLELTRCIREFDQTTPILFYSGAAFESDKRDALNAGAQSYLTKPYDFQRLIGEAQRLISATSASAYRPALVLE